MAEQAAQKNKHPYMSGTAGITQTVGHLRKQFPQTVTAETLKKLGIAPNNESFVLNILRFINVIDSSGSKTAKAGPIFNSDDEDFQKGFAELVQTGYSGLFALHGQDAWGLPQNKLISFFRNSDQTSELVGGRQTSTFQALAALAGKIAEVPKTKVATAESSKPAKKAAKSSKEQHQKPPVATQHVINPPASNNNVGLTVRIEVNLPAGADQDTYDAIFKSIRAHILSGNGS